MEIPHYVDLLKSQHFKLNGSDCVILQRKKGLGEKPPLYIYDLTNLTYISSLKEIDTNLFYFDVRNGGKYNLKLENTGKFKVVKIEGDK